MNQLFLMDANDVALLLLGVCVIPIAILIILAIIFRLKNIKKKNAKKEIKADEDQKDIFLLAYGGKENIESSVLERGKVKVVVKDIELINGEKLQELGAVGVLLVGNEVRCSFGDKAEYVYELLQ